VQCGIDGSAFAHSPPSAGPESLGIPGKVHFPLEGAGVSDYFVQCVMQRLLLT
jgi:hypothetical protein